jgi:hypothetical protein
MVDWGLNWAIADGLLERPIRSVNNRLHNSPIDDRQ